MIGALGVNGIPSQFVAIQTVDQTNFLVKDWSFTEPGSYPNGYPGLPSTYANFRYKLVLDQSALDNQDLMVPPSTSQQCSTVNGVQQCLPQYGDLVSKTTLPEQDSIPPSEKIFGTHFILKVVPPVVGTSTD